MSKLREWFGASRTEIWRRLAEELGARYVPGTFWKGDEVRVSHGEWTVTLDTYFCAATKITYTRLRAPYVNPDGFRFRIHRRGLFSDLAVMLGMQDVEVGHASFDRDFVIQGGLKKGAKVDGVAVGKSAAKGVIEAKLRALFDDARLRALLTAQPAVHFVVEKAPAQGRAGPVPAGFPAATDELCFSVPGIVKDLERLKQLFEVCAETLDQLCRIGSAYESRSA